MTTCSARSAEGATRRFVVDSETAAWHLFAR
jgi:hypothetical protein